LGTLSVSQQTEVLENSEGVRHGGYKCLLLVSSHLGELSIRARGEQHAAILLYDLVDDEHDHWRNFVAAVDDTTAVLDSCRLKHKRRAYLTVHSRRSIHKGREEGE
jgi:hypothetical protein